MSSKLSTVVSSTRSGRVARLTLDRPATLNSIGWQTLDALDEALKGLEQDGGVGVTAPARASAPEATWSTLRPQHFKPDPRGAGKSPSHQL